MKRKLLFAAALLASALGFNANAQQIEKPVEPVKPVPETTELVDDGQTVQYLYNVEAGAFLLGGNDWQTRASVSAAKGYQFKVAKNDGGETWTLNDYDEKTSTWKAVFADNAESIWVDNLNGANVKAWVITPADGNTFTISNPSAATGNLAVVPSKNDTRLYLSTDEDAQDVWAAVSEEGYVAYQAVYAEYEKEYTEYLEALDAYKKATCKVGDDIVEVAPAVWQYAEGKPGTYGTGVELYREGDNASAPAGDVITQTITGLKNGVYTVTLKLAASYTSGRGFECPTGDELSVGFVQDKTQNIEVKERGGVAEEEYDIVTLTANVLDGTLKYGIKNIAPSGNWYVASVTSIIYEKEAINVDGIIYAINGENLIQNGSFEDGFTGWTGANDFNTEISTGFELKTTGAKDGEKYLVGTTNSGTKDAKSLGTAWKIETGKTYLFNYWIKKEKSDAKDYSYLRTALTNTPGTETEVLGTPTLESNTEWCQFQKIFDNTEYQYLQVQFRWLDSQWGFDDFSLYEVEMLSSLLDVAKVNANNALDALAPVGAGLFKYHQEDIDAAKAAIEAAESVEAVEAVEMPTLALPKDGQAYAIENASAKGSLAVAGTNVMVVPNGAVYFTAVEDGYALSNAEGEYIFKTSGNNWTLSTTSELEQAYVLKVNVVEDGYTIQGSKGLFGADNKNAGSTIYADKAVADNGVWSAITEAEATYAVKISDAGYATWVAPADVDFAGAEVYIVEDVTEGDEVYAQLTAVENATEGTAVIIKAEEAEEDENKVYGYAFAVAENANSYSNNKLKASEGEVSGEGIYVLANLDNGVGFYALEDEAAVPAGKAYLEYAAGTEVKFIGFGFGGTTGINAVETAVEAENAVIYNLAGQRVANPTKGIYIMNGKKVLVK